MVGEMEVKEKPRPSPDYLMQLMNDKKLLSSLPNLCGIFTHLEQLLDEGSLLRYGPADISHRAVDHPSGLSSYVSLKVSPGYPGIKTEQVLLLLRHPPPAEVTQ